MFLENRIRAFFISKQGSKPSTARTKAPGAVIESPVVEAGSIDQFYTLCSALKPGQTCHYSETMYFGPQDNHKERF